MWEKELEAAINAAYGAIQGILDIYHQKFVVEIKEDNSPVTLADKNADKYIRHSLHKAFPDYAFLTEESTDHKSRLNNDYVWIVDPVDGTKDFVDRDNQFTTNIALAYKHEVVVGVISIPATGEIYYASKGNGSFYLKNIYATPLRIHVDDKLNDLTVLTSKHHVNERELDCISRHHDKITHRETFGSSIKACRIAHGLAEISYRFSDGTKEWDTAASQMIVEEAGGVFVKPNGDSIYYNREDVYNREGYVIINRIENLLV
jgi:3'(2'), 5'-bisphosphate nucleotidase